MTRSLFSITQSAGAIMCLFIDGAAVPTIQQFLGQCLTLSRTAAARSLRHKGVRLLRALKDTGLRDIGFGCTVSDRNSGDMLRLYDLSRELGLEFATAAFHNSYYFHKYDNVITDRNSSLVSAIPSMDTLMPMSGNCRAIAKTRSSYHPEVDMTMRPVWR